MNQKTLLRLLVLLAVFVAAAVWLNRNPGKVRIGGFASGDPVFPGLDVNKVDAVIVSSGTQTSVLSRTDGGWKADTLNGYPASFQKIADLLMALSDLKVGQVMRGGEQNPGDFGLVPGDDVDDFRRVELKIEGQTDPLVFTLGALKHQEGADAMGMGLPIGRFLQPAGGPVLLVEERFTDVSGQSEDWVNRVLLDVPADDVYTVTVIGMGDEYTIRREDDKVFTIGMLPEGQVLDQGAVQRVVQGLQSLRFDSVIAPDVENAKLGLDNPEQVVFTTSEGTVYTLSVGRDSEEQATRPVRIDISQNPMPAPSKTLAYNEADSLFTPPKATGDEPVDDAKARDEFREKHYQEMLKDYEAEEAAQKAETDRLAADLAGWRFRIPTAVVDVLLSPRTNLLTAAAAPEVPVSPDAPVSVPAE